MYIDENNQPSELNVFDDAWDFENEFEVIEDSAFDWVVVVAVEGLKNFGREIWYHNWNGEGDIRMVQDEEGHPSSYSFYEHSRPKVD